MCIDPCLLCKTGKARSWLQLIKWMNDKYKMHNVRILGRPERKNRETREEEMSYKIVQDDCPELKNIDFQKDSIILDLKVLEACHHVISEYWGLSYNLPERKYRSYTKNQNQNGFRLIKSNEINILKENYFWSRFLHPTEISTSVRVEQRHFQTYKASKNF